MTSHLRLGLDPHLIHWSVFFFFNLTLSNNDVLNFLSFASQELLQADRTFFLLLFQQVFTSDTEMLMLIISAATFIYDYL